MKYEAIFNIIDKNLSFYDLFNTSFLIFIFFFGIISFLALTIIHKKIKLAFIVCSSLLIIGIVANILLTKYVYEPTYNFLVSSFKEGKSIIIEGEVEKLETIGESNYFM